MFSTAEMSAPRDPLALAKPSYPAHHKHVVQFYETQTFLYDSVGKFIAQGLAAGEAVIVIATAAHRAGFRQHLEAAGIDVAAAEHRSQLSLLDADETLSQFMVAGMPDRDKFLAAIGRLIAQIARRYPQVNAYGEMVNLLVAQDNVAGALALEELWNELAHTHAFTLLCGYHMRNFDRESLDEAFRHVCHSHSHVLPATDFEPAQPDDAQAQRRIIAALQQQARALRSEIAQRKHAERALHETLHQLGTERARLEAVLRQMPAGVAIVDAQTEKVILANDRLREIVGQPVAADPQFVLSGQHAMMGLHEDGRAYAPHEWPLARSLARGEIVNNEEIDFLRSDRTRGALALSSAPIRGDNGDIVAAVVTYCDITEQKRARAERVKAGKLESVGLLAAGIAHDFNNILTAILGNISLAKLLNGTVDATEALGQAELASMRARDLTQQLLTFSKGGAPIKKIGSVGEFIREAAAFALRGSSVRLTLDLPDDLASAVFDAGQMSQVLNNLLINAAQAMPGGGSVALSARNVDLPSVNGFHLPAGRYVQIEVTDCGEGIPPEHLSRIFDPYFTTKKTGTGLGLATSYSIMKRHDGYIGVNSQSGQGATFTLLLPACGAGERARPSVTKSDVQRGSGRILLMDDEISVRNIGAALLERLGYQVTHAADGDDALTRYAGALHGGQRFDVVILDLTVPAAMGGRECLEKLRALDPQVQALVSSGYSTDPIMADYAAYGFAGVIAKPYRLQELSEQVQRAMASHRPARST